MQNPEPIELYLAHLMRSCSTLGPGRRVVLWVARCSRNCPGCIAEPIIGPEAGRPTDVRDLARQILAWPEANALTLTGGEPFEQADALAELCMLLRASRDFSVMAFSGFSRRELEAATDRGRRALLEQLDILVDGPFVASRMGDFLWRGSDNQQVHLLTDRHADLESALGGPSAGVDFEVADDGGFFWAGIPTPGLDEALRAGLEAKGIKLSNFRGRA